MLPHCAFSEEPSKPIAVNESKDFINGEGEGFLSDTIMSDEGKVLSNKGCRMMAANDTRKVVIDAACSIKKV